MSSVVGHRHSLDPAWLWLWPAAIISIQPLACELAYAMGVALKQKQKKKRQKQTKKPPFVCIGDTGRYRQDYLNILAYFI